MNQPQVSIFPAEMTTALYRRAIASAWRQKMLNETGSDQYGLCENLYPPSSEIRRIRGIKKERLADRSFLCTHLDL